MLPINRALSQRFARDKRNRALSEKIVASVCWVWIRTSQLGDGVPLTGRLRPYGSGGNDVVPFFMNLLLLIFVLVLLLGGGGFHFGGPAISGGGLGVVLLVCIVILFMGGFRTKT